VMDCKLLTGKICILTLIIFILVMSLAQPLYAAVAVKMISGQAVLTEGVEKARKESISDALSEALNDYIYKDMAVNHKFEPQVVIQMDNSQGEAILCNKLLRQFKQSHRVKPTGAGNPDLYSSGLI